MTRIALRRRCGPSPSPAPAKNAGTLKIYLVGYVKDPAKREVGFALSSLSVVVLLLGALWGVARQVF